MDTLYLGYPDEFDEEHELDNLLTLDIEDQSDEDVYLTESQLKAAFKKEYQSRLLKNKSNYKGFVAAFEMYCFGDSEPNENVIKYVLKNRNKFSDEIMEYVDQSAKELMDLGYDLDV